MNILMKYLLIITITLWTSLSYAEDVTVEMLNKLNNEYMVYSKKIVRVDVGDNVFWQSTDKGHNVEFIKGAIPDGVEKFKSKINKDVQYKFTIPGIYAYWCTPHKSMGMIGFVIVGNDLSNLDKVSKTKFSGKSKKVAKTLLEQLS
jgi:pseudoazurin